MGKIRVSTLGSKEEKESREKRKVQREEKKKRAGAAGEKVHIAGLKGGQRVKSVGTSEEEIDKMVALAREVEKDQTEGIKPETEEGKSKKKKKAKVRSKKYQAAVMKLDHQKKYPLNDALEVLRQVSYGKFNGSVETCRTAPEKRSELS